MSLAQQRVVVGRHDRPHVERGVKAHLRASRDVQHGDVPAGREEVGGLRVDAALDGVVGDGDVVLREGELGAGGHAQLPLHEVDAAHELGDGVLHLQARVHLHEVEAAVVRKEELDRAHAHVAHRAREVAGGLVHALAHAGVRVQAGRGALLDELLVAALHGALALAEGDHVAVRVRQDLHLNVVRRRDELLHVALAVAKGGLGLGVGLGEGLAGVLGALDLADARDRRRRSGP